MLASAPLPTFAPRSRVITPNVLVDSPHQSYQLHSLPGYSITNSLKDELRETRKLRAFGPCIHGSLRKTLAKAAHPAR
jgi:hypothetical protein